MHQVTGRHLGGQQHQRLRRLREASDKDVRERHLKRSGGSSLYDPKQPLDPLASRTVDAIVQERLDKDNVSTSTRIRDKVAAARRGVQTERTERPGDELRPVERTTRKIVTVRRRGFNEEERSDGRRRMGKQEAEWIEKQLQYKMRVVTLEKECHAAWQSFFAGAGTSSTSEVNKLIEEMETMREQDVNKMKHQLQKLSSKVNDVQTKVEEIENGNQFFSELQERIDAMEAALAKFRLGQRQQFEGYILEEKLLEKELAVFMENTEGWENETPRLRRGGARTASLGPRLAHLNSKSGLHLDHNTCSQRSGNDNEDNGSNQDEDRSLKRGTPDELGMVDRVRRLNDAILRTGGLKHGWDNREHATFTTLLIKYGLTDDILLQHSISREVKTRSPQLSASCQSSNQEELSHSNNRDYETRVARFVRNCMRKIVTQTENSVRSHFEWYLRHLELVDEKKHVIQEWKMRKEEERQQIIQCGFDANGEGIESLDEKISHDSSSHNQQTYRAKVKSREKTERLLEQWKLDKKHKEEEREQRRQEIRKKREAAEAKRKQEQLDAKQNVLLYKLHKEQEAMMLDRTAKHRQDGVTDDSLLMGPFSSPTSKEDLVERSRIAIEYAKAKRLRLQQIEERRQKQQQLPPRPESKTADESANSSTKPALVLNPTEASKARDLSKEELRKKARRRERQSAHDAYIPGKRALSDVKFKSFGHIPIQPRAVPAWRKNI